MPSEAHVKNYADSEVHRRARHKPTEFYKNYIYFMELFFSTISIKL